MSPGLRRIFGFAAFLPIIAIVALSIWAQSEPSVQRLLDFDVDAVKQFTTRTWVVVGLLFGTTIFLQIGLGAAVGFYCEKRTDMDIAHKILWTMACVFVGSIALPIFYFRVLRKD